MARTTIRENVKFKKLCRALQMPRAHVLGHLEFLWMTAHDSGSPFFSEEEDLEIAADWDGEPGTLAGALLQFQFVEPTSDGKLQIHDYWEHAPEYVKARTRMRERRGGTCSEQFRTVTNSSPLTEPNRTEPNRIRNRIKAEPEPERARGPSRVGVDAALGRLMETASVLGSEFGAFNTNLQDRILRVTGEEGWSQWWGEVLERVEDARGRMDEIENAVRYAESCADPAVRRAKDLGELKRPGAYLVGKAQAVCKAAGVRWPSFPEGARA